MIRHFGNSWQIVWVEDGVSLVELYNTEEEARSRATEVRGAVYPPNGYHYNVQEEE
jgi:hypothetical protein